MPPLGQPLSPQDQAAYQAYITNLMRSGAPPGPMPKGPPGHFQDWGIASQTSAFSPDPQLQGPPPPPPPPFNAGPPMPAGPLGAANAQGQNRLGPPTGIPGMPRVSTPAQAQYYAQTVRPPMGALSGGAPPPPPPDIMPGAAPLGLPGATMPAPLGGPPMMPSAAQAPLAGPPTPVSGMAAAPQAPTPPGAPAVPPPGSAPSLAQTPQGASMLDFIRNLLGMSPNAQPGAPGGAPIGGGQGLPAQ